MSSDTLSQDQFSKIASALLGKSQGEVDITDRAKLLAFAKALVNDDSDASGEDSPTPAKRCVAASVPKRRAVVTASSDEESIKPEEVSDSEDEEAALEAMLLKAQQSVTENADPQTD